jgi:hypothetical protein
MPWTEADINTLKQALLDRKGARSIAFSDQVVTFDSIDDMLKLLAVMQQEVGTHPHTRYAAFDKGV